MAERRLDASALRDWAHTGVGHLIRHSDEINALNVFPVADSDTGTNMLFTLRAGLAEVDPGACGDVKAVTAALARGALNGARGNSGVILSQILRALAEVTADADRDLADIDVGLLGAALRHAVALVVAAMGGHLVAGTVVSVLQAAAAAVEEAADQRSGLPQAVFAAGEAAADALDRTPEQLDVLAEAGVVDAGGRGLLVLLDALTATVTGQAPARRVYLPAAPVAQPDLSEPPPPRFEVMYLLGGRDAGGDAGGDAEGDAGVDAAALDGLRSALHALGDSVALAAAADGRHSVHVHTDDAGAAIEAGLAAGTVSRIRISALDTGRVAPGGWTRQRAVLAVVDGAGAEELFAGEGACVVCPDAELVDPADGVGADQLLRALVDTGAAQVMVLPNGYVSAEDLVAGCTAAIGWGIDVVPLPCGSMVQGLAALAVHDAGRQAVDDGYTMARAAAGSRHGSVRIATEQALTWAGACLPGDGLGISGDEVVVVDPDPVAAAQRLTDLLLGSGGELVTVLLGAALLGAGADPRADDVADSLAAHVRRRHPGTEFSSYRTGHRGDILLIGVE
jgi:DAK2 domain fusion protein YloV